MAYDTSNTVTWTVGSAQHFEATTVTTIDGYCGQITFRSVIVWESRPYKRRERALAAADDHLSLRIRELFS